LVSTVRPPKAQGSTWSTWQVVDGGVAQGMEALPVADLDRPAGGAGEDAPAHAHVLDPVGAVEDDPLGPGLVQPAHQ